MLRDNIFFFFFFGITFTPRRSIFFQFNDNNNNNKNVAGKIVQKEELKKPKVSGRTEIPKIRAKINEIETKNTTEKISEIKSWFFEMINKMKNL